MPGTRSLIIHGMRVSRLANVRCRKVGYRDVRCVVLSDGADSDRLSAVRAKTTGLLRLSSPGALSTFVSSAVTTPSRSGTFA